MSLCVACGEKDPDDTSADDSGADDSAPAQESAWTASENEGCGAPVSANLVTVTGAEYGEHTLLISDQPFTCEERLAARAQIVEADRAYTAALENTGSTGQALCEAAVARWQAHVDYFDPFYGRDQCAVEIFFQGALAEGYNYGWLDYYLGLPVDSAGVLADLGDCATDAGATYEDEDYRIFAAVYANIRSQNHYIFDAAALDMEESGDLVHFTFAETEIYPSQGTQTLMLGFEVYAERCEQ
ncbi:MAG: hypothetical protein H6741_13035 [Alphaproteobacteria bacterium]|nr:hypothetical protein [Alphaproteobacteria bacterium]